jgi:hypothetical protein
MPSVDAVPLAPRCDVSVARSKNGRDLVVVESPLGHTT